MPVKASRTRRCRNTPLPRLMHAGHRRFSRCYAVISLGRAALTGDLQYVIRFTEKGRRDLCIASTEALASFIQAAMTPQSRVLQ
jgi:hypothetical protein